MRIMHMITRLILGGAQENTVLTVEGQHANPRDRVVLVTGPTTGPEGSLMDRVRRAGVDVRVVPELRRNLHPVREMVALWKLYRLCRTWEPDVVHTHSSKAGILGRIAARLARVPIVVHTIHGLPFHPYETRWRNRLYITMERLAARCADRIICVADAMTDQAVAAGVAPRETFRTIYSGMEVDTFLRPDADRARTRAALGFAPRDVVVGKIARLFELKGHTYVIQAARHVVQQCPDVKFLFVGDGTWHEDIQKQIDDAGLHDRFALTGLVPPERIPELIQAMDIVVHASLREGLARVLPQALISGKPVISYDVDGAREVTIPDETGYLLPPESIDALADAVVDLARHPDKRERMGRRGRELFTEPFRWQHMVREIHRVYDEVAASRL